MEGKGWDTESWDSPLKYGHEQTRAPRGKAKGQEERESADKEQATVDAVPKESGTELH